MVRVLQLNLSASHVAGELSDIVPTSSERVRPPDRRLFYPQALPNIAMVMEANLQFCQFLSTSDMSADHLVVFMFQYQLL